MSIELMALAVGLIVCLVNLNIHIHRLKSRTLDFLNLLSLHLSRLSNDGLNKIICSAKLPHYSYLA